MRLTISKRQTGRRTAVLGLSAALVGVLVNGCHSTSRATGAKLPTTSAATATATRTPVASSPVVATPSTTSRSPGSSSSADPVPTATPSEAFIATASTVTAAELGASWHPGCPVGPAALRALKISYWGFDDAPHVGTLVVSS